MNQAVTISVLLENHAKMDSLEKKFVGQHGLSLFVEAASRVLFDTGPTDAFIGNARLMGIDLETMDCIVLSHGHWDHTDGLSYLRLPGEKIPLVAHPGLFADRHRASGQYNGTVLTKKELGNRFHLILSREPYKIGEDILFLGEIPRINDFEARKTPFFCYRDGRKENDFLLDDTALAVKTDKGLIVLTGCSHAGICNIVEYAKEVCNDDRVRAVLGGFHLLKKGVQLEKTIDYFSKNRVEALYPMHCTSFEALSRFHEVLGIRKLCAGDTLVFQ